MHGGIVKIRLIVVLVAFVVLLAGGLAAQKGTATESAVAQLGPYKLGTTYNDLKGLAGFVDDPTRTNPAEDIKAAKIIARNLFNTPTIQRFFFRHDRLIRISIIFHPPEEWPEERVKRLVAEQWGQPDGRESFGGHMFYQWKGSTGRIVILPSVGGRWMASCFLHSEPPLDLVDPVISR